jgi:hypothetical protein
VFVYGRKVDSSVYPDWLLANNTEIAEEDKELSDIYLHIFNDDNIEFCMKSTAPGIKASPFNKLAA